MNPIANLETELTRLASGDPFSQEHGTRVVASTLLVLLQRTGWRKLTETDCPAQNQHCLIWLKGAEHATMSTMSVSAERRKYFLLANSGTVRRAFDEVTHWMPLPAGPHGG